MTWLKAIRSHYLDGTVQAVGAVYEAPAKLAVELIATGKAVQAAAPVVPEPEPVETKRQPRTRRTKPEQQEDSENA